MGIMEDIRVNISAIDVMNARNAHSLEEMAQTGGVYEIAGFGIKNDSVTKEDGSTELKAVTILKTTDGKIYSGVSAVAADFIDDLNDVVIDGDITLPIKISAEIRNCKGNAQRKFVSLTVHEN